MVRVPNYRAVVVALVLMAGFLFVGDRSLGAPLDCDPVNPVACTTHSTISGNTVHGWLLVPGRAAELQESASSASDCAECIWSISQECTMSSGQAGPGGEHCTGIFVGCKAVEVRIVVLFQATPAAMPEQIDTYCYATSDGGVVTAATVEPDVRRYATQLTVGTPSIATYPPKGVTLVNLPTYFAATARATGEANIGGQNYSLRLQVAADEYTWRFGDGASLTTSDPGGPPPDGAVCHTYLQEGPMSVALTVDYGATYTVVTPFGSLGPEVVAGGPVRTLPATAGLQVRQAYAGLTG